MPTSLPVFATMALARDDVNGLMNGLYIIRGAEAILGLGVEIPFSVQPTIPLNT